MGWLLLERGGKPLSPLLHTSPEAPESAFVKEEKWQVKKNMGKKHNFTNSHL